jgi:copper chaperone CopZ
MEYRIMKKRSPQVWSPLVACLMVLFSMILCSPARAGTFKHQVTGLFMKEPEQDLREAVQRIPQIKLLSTDFENAEATFEYDPAKAFPGAKSSEIIQRFGSQLTSASNRTFGIKALSTVSRDKLQHVEIPVAGLDCKACSLAAYEAVYTLEGVERVTASFREGRVTEWIDPRKANRAKLEAALEERGVQLKSPGMN